MRTVNIHEAKTHLSKLIDDAVKGEPFIIAKAGKPLVRVVAIDAAEIAKSRIGGLEGRYQVPEDFNHWMEDEIAEMFGV